MVDGGSLENCCTARYRGFESLFLREIGKNQHQASLSADFFLQVVVEADAEAEVLRAVEEGGAARAYGAVELDDFEFI